MTGLEETPPPALRQVILDDLRPVRPLRRPFVRALVFWPLAILLVTGQAAVFGLRRDAGSLGFPLLWGLSAAQALAGLAFLVSALREAVPGPTRTKRSAVLLGLAFLWTVAVTLLTWTASATVVPRGGVAFFWRVCFGGPLAIGLPVLGLVLALAARAFPLRPGWVGALAGIGVGLITDAGWRTFCHVSDPSHVLLAHVAAIMALTLIGALTARLWLRTPS